jgi:hypothetical protein
MKAESGKDEAENCKKPGERRRSHGVVITSLVTSRR